MRHPNGITELEDQMVSHFRLPHPGGRPEDFQKYIYLTQVITTLMLSGDAARDVVSKPGFTEADACQKTVYARKGALSIE